MANQIDELEQEATDLSNSLVKSRAENEQLKSALKAVTEQLQQTQNALNLAQLKINAVALILRN